MKKTVLVFSFFLCFFNIFADEECSVVKKVQLSLKIAGYYDGEVTCVKDLKTTSAIRIFQKSNQVKSEGEITSETLMKLSLDLMKKNPGSMAVTMLSKDLLDIATILLEKEHEKNMKNLEESYKLKSAKTYKNQKLKSGNNCENKALKHNINGHYLIFEDGEIYKSEDEDVSDDWSDSDNYVICSDKIINTSESSDNTVEVSELSFTVSAVMKSTIDGDNNGFDSDTIFKLSNGQIWQQSEYAYSYSYSYRRDVWILKTNQGYKIILEDIEDEMVGVKRLK